MPDQLDEQLGDHVRAAEGLRAVLPAVRAVGEVLCSAYGRSPRGVLYTFGNGGSAADAQHLTGELIGHYRCDRAPLPAVSLSTDPTVLTCIVNDFDASVVFARQVSALARPGDVVAAFTTSGRSPNVVAGLQAAQGGGATTVLFTGGDGGPALAHADHVLLAPSALTPRIQEMHTLMLHMISEIVDAWAAGQAQDT